MGSRDKAPSGGLGAKPQGIPPHYLLLDARRAIQNRFITNLVSVGHSGFALGSLLGIVVLTSAYIILNVRKSICYLCYLCLRREKMTKGAFNK